MVYFTSKTKWSITKNEHATGLSEIECVLITDPDYWTLETTVAPSVIYI